MKTIIAEKPSVAREIARIVGATKREEGYFEGGGYAVTWAFGHLVQLAMPDGYGIRGFVRDNLPVIPDTFTLVPRQTKTEKGYKPDSGVAAQIKVIATLFNRSEQIIVATDAGREGELIFRYLYHYIGCTTPFVRLWISSLTDKVSARGCATSKRAANTTISILPPKRGANQTGSWASTARRHSPSPPDTAHIPSDGCRHLHWQWCAHAIGRTAASHPKPFGSSISQRTAATKEQ